MTREDIFKMYLATLSISDAFILLAVLYFIFAGNYRWGGWMLFGLLVVTIVIRILELEYCDEFGYSPWNEEDRRLVNLRSSVGGKNEMFYSGKK